MEDDNISKDNILCDLHKQPIKWQCDTCKITLCPACNSVAYKYKTYCKKCVDLVTEKETSAEQAAKMFPFFLKFILWVTVVRIALLILITTLAFAMPYIKPESVSWTNFKLGVFSNVVKETGSEITVEQHGEVLGIVISNIATFIIIIISIYKRWYKTMIGLLFASGVMSTSGGMMISFICFIMALSSKNIKKYFGVYKSKVN